MKNRNDSFFNLTLVDICAVIIGIIGCIVYILPSDTYTRILGEKLYTRLNIQSVYFIIACTLVFLLGSFLSSKVKIISIKGIKGSDSETLASILRTGYVALFFAGVLSIIYMYIVSRAFSLSYLLSGSNDSRYQLWVFLSNNKLGFIIPVAVSLCCFGIYTTIVHSYKNLVNFLPLLFVTGLIITVAQLLGIKAIIFNIAIALAASIYLLYIRRSIGKNAITVIFGVGIFALVLFFLYSVSQRIVNMNGLNALNATDIYMYSIFGYFFSGINKFAYIYSGGELFNNLSFWNIFAPIINTPLLGGLYAASLNDFGIATSSINPDAWQSSFGNVSLSGFNSGFNVISIYGNLYGNFNWFGIAIMFFYGLISRSVWRCYVSGSILGIVLLPYILFSTIQWLVYDPFFSRDFMINIFVAGLLFLTQEIFIKRMKL